MLDFCKQELETQYIEYNATKSYSYMSYLRSGKNYWENIGVIS